MSSGDDELTNNTTTITHLTSTPPSSSLEQLYITSADMVDHVFRVEPSSHNNTTILLFPNLKRIHVQYCRRLQSFAPFFMSFPNLVSLEVSNCHGLRYLLSSSTATTLVQLQRMEITNCDEMKEIIINHNGNEDKSTHHHSLILFQNLKILQLKDMPNLQSFFYSENKVIMSFPNLEELYITRCSKMRRFLDGIVNTSASLLKTIEIDDEIIPLLERDVNATLAKLFKENNNNNDSDLGLPHLLAHQTVCTFIHAFIYLFLPLLFFIS
ncbi:uncharacterized protein LOC115695605 [Cannabis sativa]|uniref:uncharacterized protein LOC115695605 n=1 Tax=Cannabis sativa TaxID=3483 RepID=UPI0029CA1BD7|nr:uncharacterized protein LOC115695605 [Cannabis sativa]